MIPMRLNRRAKCYGDKLDSVAVWMSNGNQTSEVITVDAEDMGNLKKPHSVRLPLNEDAEPGEWESHAELKVSRSSGEDVSANYKLGTGAFTMLPSERKAIRIDIREAEVTGLRPLQAHFDVQMRGWISRPNTRMGPLMMEPSR